MNLENKKPIWLWSYYTVSAILFIFGVMVTLMDKTGFTILIAGPIMISGVLLASLSYTVYRSKKNNKKTIVNFILWVLFILFTSSLVWQIIQITIWFKTVGFQGWPIVIGNLILFVLFLILIIILNKKEE
ncbi:hypothetical protein A3B84_02380 [Candidatus Nomurabacteria bacterium RIFCSPHIGHO2_02_FULL_35_13]|uniref:Major facilitator superfamily (MFS) profile domain-containing protein n=1 Tax=Candidatus Nomurabacteria bacterium RIFCSPHIGHO2_02_FULL_35_13 TaxID=1801748 RepID=A0A1F6VMT9_9BACT|nr:MAG: hypothetical protein A3B84_02380 [Candidatus Nomurabacteria bacterium RIFCSPHIGHO2_02_FULL_35_13]